MKKNKIFNIVTISILILSIILGIVIPTKNVFNTIFKTIALVDSVVMTVYALAKEDKIYKIVSIIVLLSLIMGYIIPGTTVQYGAVEKGTINPVTFVDLFTNLIYSANVFVPAFTYVLVIGAFYTILNKTGKYDSLVNNVAVTFNKNKGLFVVLTIFALGLVTFFTGEFYTLLIFVPFLISVVKKLGYKSETAVLTTVGSILLGNAGSMYTYYTNQILSLTVKDNVLTKVIVLLTALVLLVAFILVFCEKPNTTKELKKETGKKLAPLHIAMWLIFILLILGFVNWEGYFGFKGFDKFLETLRKGQIAKISIFDLIVGKTIVSFGTWQLFNASVLFLFVGLIIGLIYKLKFDDLMESVKEGFKKAFPYAMIVVLAILVLVNVAYSGTFYTMIVDITSKKVNLLTSTVVGVLTSIFSADSVNAAQFAVYSASLTKASGYQNLLAITYQAVYSLFLLISPTSILLLLGLKYTGIKYRDWIKYIYKFFIVLFITLLVVINFTVNIKFGLSDKTTVIIGIISLVLLVVAFVILFWYKLIKTAVKHGTIEANKVLKETKKEEVKEENKKTPAKKSSTKKNTTNKNSKKKK